jgi:hypothetical protein
VTEGGLRTDLLKSEDKMSEPVSKAILLCNYATFDKSNRWSLIDTFNTLYVRAVPCASKPFYVFVSAVDVPKSPTLMFQVENPGGMVIWTSGPILMENEGLNGLQYICGVPSIMFIGLGKYRVVFHLNSDRLAETELSVAMATEGVPT